MNRELYARNYSTVANDFNRVTDIKVPDDVERREESFPCSYCGVRAGLPCKHRRLAA